MDLSIVIPIFNEMANLIPLRDRLEQVFEGRLPNLRWEVILVNDGSRDSSLDIMLDLHSQNPRFKVLNLSRNFGHQLAITAGMEHAKGDAVVVMDGDLQDPPEVISDMWKAYENGADVAYGQRNRRDGESWFKLFTASFFYRLLQKVARIHIPVDTGDFRLMSRRAVDALLQCRESHRFVRGLVSWVGFRQEAVLYDREERFSGSTKYPLTKMMAFAWDGITSFSTLPLKLATWLGSMTIFAGFAYAIRVMYLYFFDPDELVRGWSSLVLILLILGGVQLLILGMLGEYMGRISDEIKHRPLYLVDKFYGDASPYPKIEEPSKNEGELFSESHSKSANHSSDGSPELPPEST
jgi:dolichol-phosphate mannosyltransferase